MEPGRAAGANGSGSPKLPRGRPPKPKNRRGGLQKLSPRSARFEINSSVILTSTTGCLALAQNLFTACRVWSPNLPSMRPLKQSRRRNSVCAFLICLGELAPSAAGASATDDRPGSAAPRPATGTFCANSATTASAGSMHSEKAIAADPTLQPPCIANFLCPDRLPQRSMTHFSMTHFNDDAVAQQSALGTQVRGPGSRQGPSTARAGAGSPALTVPRLVWRI